MAEDTDIDIIELARRAKDWVDNDLEPTLRAAISSYEHKVRELRVARDAIIRHAAELGMRQVDIVNATGYNRETIRQIVKAGEKESNDA